jgi:hypothetical protein
MTWLCRARHFRLNLAMNPPHWFFCIFVLWCVALCLKADLFIVVLELQGRTTTECITNPPGANVPAGKVRPVLHAGVDEPLKVRFRIEQVGGPIAEDAVVHLFVARVEKLNQIHAPDMKIGVVIMESALATDFKTGQSVRGSFSFSVSHPSLYLVRVEGKDMAPPGLEEPFAALDLSVKQEAAK